MTTVRKNVSVRLARRPGCALCARVRVTACSRRPATAVAAPFARCTPPPAAGPGLRAALRVMRPAAASGSVTTVHAVLGCPPFKSVRLSHLSARGWNPSRPTSEGPPAHLRAQPPHPRGEGLRGNAPHRARQLKCLMGLRAT